MYERKINYNQIQRIRGEEIMKVIIAGMGRMGTGLAVSLDRKGHDVTVIDSDPIAFNALGEGFKGKKTEGSGFDKEILEKAGIESADAVVSCTDSDEVNAVIARLARNFYRVPRVIARLYDPKKADVYRRLGIQTISTTTWGIERAMEIITFNRLDSIYEMGNGNVNLLRIEAPHVLIGRRVDDITSMGEIQVVSINRNGKTFIPTLGAMFEPEDVVYLAVYYSAIDKLKKMFDLI